MLSLTGQNLYPCLTPWIDSSIMTRLLFGQAYYLRFDAKLWEAMKPYPPLGTMIAASLMRRKGYEVALFDAMLAKSEAAWAAALDREPPDIAIIYEDNFNYLSKMCLLRMRQACFTMIEMANKRGLPVIVAGSDPSDHAAAYLGQGADFVLLGEGEATLAALLDRLTGRTSQPLSQIEGLAYHAADPLAEGNNDSSFALPQTGSDEGESRYLRTPARPDIKALDDLPFPAWDLVDVERYRRIWLDRHGYYAMNMVTTRGCPYHCNWCAKPIWGQRYNSRSPENVVEEMVWLKETYGPDYIWFADDIMGLKPGWLEKFSQLVAEKQAQIPFKCLSRADLLLRGDTIRALKRAGCDFVWIGAESGSQKILDAMEKKTRVEQIVEATEKMRQADFRIAYFLQFGYPGETRADIEKTLALVRRCQPDDIGMSVSYPLPGTPFHERVRDELGLKQNWLDSADFDMLYHGPFVADFYRKLHTVLHKEHRSMQTWRRLPELARNMGRTTVRQLLRMLYYRLSLPLDRRRLDRLAKQSHQGPESLPPGMSYQAAATPTPQTER